MRYSKLVQAMLAAGLLSASAAGIAAPDAALVKARIKFFGPENVDNQTGAVKKDKILYSWLSHNAAAVAMDGRVFMLESFVRRLEVVPGRTPFVIRDLVELKPEAIFIGHGHSDHADNAAFIAAKTGATLYMTPEACGTANTALTRMKNDPFMQADPFYAIPMNTTIKCEGITTAGSVPGTELVRVTQFEPHICINGFRALHSTAVPPDPDWGPVVVVDTPDPLDPIWFPAGVPLTPQHAPAAGPAGPAAGPRPGGRRSDRLPVRAAPLAQLHALLQQQRRRLQGRQGQQLAARHAGRRQAHPRPAAQPAATDFNFASISSGNTDENGWRDHVYHLEALRPKIMVTGHVPTGAAMQYFSGFMNHLKLMENPKNAWPGFPKSEWPIVRNNTDPTDILKPMVFDPDSEAWKHPDKKARVAQFCGQ